MLDEENDARRLGGKAKINPPIRPRAEVEKLWRHLAPATSTLVSTDHVSWSDDRKTDPDMLANSSGVPGLETDGPALRQGRAGPRRSAHLDGAADGRESRAALPARSCEGRADAGTDADIMVLTPEILCVHGGERQQCRRLVALRRHELPWTVAATYVRGRLAFDGTKVLAEPGSGRFVRPPERISRGEGGMSRNLPVDADTHRGGH